MPNTLTFTPQDYTSTLAMLNHEGANGILDLLRRGNSADAYGYVGGLIDAWMNRAASRGDAPWQEMNRPYQITGWDPSQIQAKAGNLDPRIKAMADAYLQDRANGGQPVAPGASFYLNTDLVRATPSYGEKWKDWYDPGTIVTAYGDKKQGGKSSLQTEFVKNSDEYNVPDYTFRLDPSLGLNPAASGQQAAAEFNFRRNPLSYDPNNSVNAWARNTGLADTLQNLGLGDPRTSFAQQYRLNDIPRIDGTEAGRGFNVSGDVAAQSLLDYYHGILGRNPDPQGWQAQVDALNHGASLRAIEDSIAGSSEAQSRYRDLSTRLGNGDADLVRSLTDPLGNTNVSSGSGTQAFSDFYAPLNHIAQDYRDFLGRNPTKEEAGAWLDQLGQGRGFEAIDRDIAGSQEASSYAATQGVDPLDWIRGMGYDPTKGVSPINSDPTASLPTPPATAAPSVPGAVPNITVPDAPPVQIPGDVPNVSVPDVPTASIPADVPNIDVPPVQTASVPGDVPFINPGDPFFGGVPGAIPNTVVPDVPNPFIPGEVPFSTVPDVPTPSIPSGPSPLSPTIDLASFGGFGGDVGGALGATPTGFPGYTPLNSEGWGDPTASLPTPPAVPAPYVPSPDAAAPGPFDFAGGLFNPSQGVNPQAFGDTYAVTPSAPAAPSPNPFDFAGGYDPSQGIGPQGFGDTYPVPAAAPAAPTAPTATIAPWQFANGFGAGESLGATPTTFPGYTPLSSDGGSYAATPGPFDFPGNFGLGEGVGPQTFGSHYPVTPSMPAAPVTPFDFANGYSTGQGIGPQGFSDAYPVAAATPAAPAATLDPFGFSSGSYGGETGFANFGNTFGPTPSAPGPSITPTSYAGGFNPGLYLAMNPDVAAAGIDPLQHYLSSGYREGRLGTGIIDMPTFLSVYGPQLGAAAPTAAVTPFGFSGGDYGASVQPAGFGETFGFPAAPAGPASAPTYSAPVSPFGFSGMDAGSVAEPGTFGDYAPPPTYYPPAPAYTPAPAPGPFDFSGMNAGSTAPTGSFGDFAPSPSPVDTAIASASPQIGDAGPGFPNGGDAYVPTSEELTYNSYQRGVAEQAAYNRNVATANANFGAQVNNGALNSQPIVATPLAPIPTSYAGINVFAPPF